MKWTIVLAVTACAALAAPCGAEDHYPSRPVKLVLPQPAGGAVDLIARALADRTSSAVVAMACATEFGDVPEDLSEL